MDEANVPPVVPCAICGVHDCDVCPTDKPKTAASSSLPWERDGSYAYRLWGTALNTSNDPESSFGELSDGPILPAIAFALHSETLAIGSLFLAALLMAVVVAPTLTWRAVTDPALQLLMAGIPFGLVCLMLVLHALMGISVELGAALAGEKPRWRLGMRFGLYACGWDLLTSPAGVLQGLLARGPFEAWRPIRNAVRAPRRATYAYSHTLRHWPRQANRAALLTSVVVLGGLLMLLAAGLFAQLLTGITGSS